MNKKIIIGTAMTPDSIKAGFPYMRTKGRRLSIWSILDILIHKLDDSKKTNLSDLATKYTKSFGNLQQQQAIIDQINSILNDSGIVLIDAIAKCEFKKGGWADKDIIFETIEYKVISNELKEMFESSKSIVNGYESSSKSRIIKEFFKKNNLNESNIVYAPSSVPGAKSRFKKNSDIANEWYKLLT